VCRPSSSSRPTNKASRRIAGPLDFQADFISGRSGYIADKNSQGVRTTDTTTGGGAIVVGAVYGRLTVLSVRRGAKNRHGKAVCRCSCGGERSVRHTSLRRGRVSACARCARLDGSRRGAILRRLPEPERWLRNAIGVYKANARAKGLPFTLPVGDLRTKLLEPCSYCGKPGPGGLDRDENALGYVAGNVVACCSTCNYAKRDMPRGDFLAWVERIHAHQGLLQRDRAVRVRVAEQPDGRGPHHARRDL
jgi:hypothetical protein